jgi:HSP20 family protein
MTDKELQKQKAETPAEVKKTREWPTYLPAVDIVETQDAFTLDIDLPGVTPEDISIEFDEGVLSLSAERTCAGESGECLLSEFESCSYERNFTVSTPVKSDEIAADYRHGVLHLVLPKAESAKPRKIAITTE